MLKFSTPSTKTFGSEDPRPDGGGITTGQCEIMRSRQEYSPSEVDYGGKRQDLVHRSCILKKSAVECDVDFGTESEVLNLRSR